MRQSKTSHGERVVKDIKRKIRKQYSAEEKIKVITAKEGVSEGTLKALETLDLDAAAKSLSSELGKDYVSTPDKGRISGTYREAITRPSGKYAVIEKSKEFTLVPWCETMDRNLGKSISGSLKGQTISWMLNKTRGKAGVRTSTSVACLNYKRTLMLCFSNNQLNHPFYSIIFVTTIE